MLHVVWEFHVKPECHEDFEAHYGPRGAWAMLFRKSPFYDRTILTHDSNTPTRYLLTDVWVDLASLESFKKNFRQAYDALDKNCLELTTKEECLGYFELIEDKKPNFSPRDNDDRRDRPLKQK